MATNCKHLKYTFDLDDSQDVKRSMRSGPTVICCAFAALSAARTIWLVLQVPSSPNVRATRELDGSVLFRDIESTRWDVAEATLLHGRR